MLFPNKNNSITNLQHKICSWQLYFVLVIVSFSFGCHQKIRTNQPSATALHFTKIEANNLSEGLTKNDEIELHTFFIKKDKQNPVRKINHFVFDESNKSFELSNAFNLVETSGYYVIVLVEQDVEQDNSANNNQLLFVELSKQTFVDNPREVLRLDELLGDDDVLDLKYLPIENLKVKDNFELKFEGLHLFDRFEYTLYCKTD